MSIVCWPLRIMSDGFCDEGTPASVMPEWCSVLITNFAAATSALAIASASGYAAAVILPAPTAGGIFAGWVEGAPPITLASTTG